MKKYCPACKEYKALKDFHADKSKANGCGTYCRVCTLEKLHQKRKEDPEHYRQINRRYKDTHREELQARSRTYYYAHQEEEQRKARERHHKHPEAAKIRHRNTKIKALQVVSPEVKCQYCGETDVSRLEIDHVDGDGKHQRVSSQNIHYLLVREGLPADIKLQILCEKHNAMKSWLPESEFKKEVQKLYDFFFETIPDR